MTPWPGYPLYPLIARAARGQAVPVPGFSTDALLLAVNDRTRIVALANPNDPTGELLRTGELRRLLQSLPERVVVLLDEALRDFVDRRAGGRCDRAPRGVPAAPGLPHVLQGLGTRGAARAGTRSGGEGAEDRCSSSSSPSSGSTSSRSPARSKPSGTTARSPRTARPPSPPTASVSSTSSGSDGCRWCRRRPTCCGSPRRISTAPSSRRRLDRGGITVRGGSVLGDPDRVRITVPHRPDGVERLLRALDGALTQA